MARTLIRLQSIDQMKLFTSNIVNRCQKHFQKITHCLTSKDGQSSASTSSLSSTQLSYYAMSAHLANDNTEIEFLRKLSDLLLSLLLPPNYSNCKPLRHLLREIFAIQVLYKSINYICDPNYLNEKILEYLQWQHIEVEHHRKAYAYAETYEEFVKVINRCNDIEDLKRMAYYIVTEIMQSTVINNLKRERGIDYDKGMFSGPITSAKGDQLQARNLKRYINQLRYAKNLCEKRISMLGGGDKQYQNMTSVSNDVMIPPPNRKTVLAFKIIMNSDMCRSYLRKFMQYSVTSSSNTPESRKYLIVFWESVKQLRKEEISKQYQIANEILSHPHFIISLNAHIKLPKTVLKGMEEFIMGNKGPDSFYFAQSSVYEVLEHRYYPLFIVSKEYDEMMEQFTDTLENNKFEESIKVLDHKKSNFYNSIPNISISNADEYDDGSVNLSSDCVIDMHASQSKLKLKALREKYKDKRHAVKALRKTEHDRGKLMNQNLNVNAKLIQMLEKEIDDITREQQQLENHLEWTLLWMEAIGKWITKVHNIDFNPNEELYLIIMIVHRNDIEVKASNGWVITRTHHQFKEFRDSLVKHYPIVKKYEIPKFKSKISLKNDEKYIMILKHQLQLFFNSITANDIISKSEELYLFLSQSNESLRRPLSAQLQDKVRLSKLPFANLFGITSNQRQSVSDSVSSDEEQLDERLLILDDAGVKENSKDDIAEPLYNLFSEVFELRGVYNLLRRTLITFVQVTYGKSINKQLRDIMEWICSESMVHYYLTSFKNSIWPNGVLAESSPEKSDNEKKKTQTLAKQYLLSCIPELIINFLGHQNAKKGMAKVFDALQDKNLNKQLCYELIETFMFEFAPELKTKHETAL